jgi:hypothetical protein
MTTVGPAVPENDSPPGPTVPPTPVLPAPPMPPMTLTSTPGRSTPLGLRLLREVHGWTWSDTLRIAFLFMVVVGVVAFSMRYALDGIEPTWATAIAGFVGVGSGGAAVAVKHRRGC